MQYTRIKYHIMGSPLRFVFSFDLDVSKWEVSVEYTKRNEVVRKDIHLKPSQMFCINEILTPKTYNGFISGEWNKHKDIYFDGYIWTMWSYDNNGDIIFKFGRSSTKSYYPPRELRILSNYIQEIAGVPGKTPEGF